MILYDSRLCINFRDYGIMIPIPSDRGGQVLQFLEKNFYPGTRGSTMPYPGPVFDIPRARVFLGNGVIIDGANYGGANGYGRDDVERVHSRDFAASLYGEGLEAALLSAFELIDSQGRPCRYEPEKARKPLADLFGLLLEQAEGTYLACRLALAEGPGFCYYMGGGQHHARYDGPSGFCLINDVVLAVSKITAEHRAGLVWIVDLDAHKGDGTAELIRFARDSGRLAGPGNADRGNADRGNADRGNAGFPCVLTLSIHMARGWPLDKESLSQAREGRAPLLPSDIDIGIDSGEEGEYCPRLAAGLQELEALSERAGRGKPDLVLVVDGADPYEHDGLPSTAPLKLSLDQCVERDMLVYRYVMDRKIPSAWIAAGGYGDRAWEPPAYFLQKLR